MNIVLGIIVGLLVLTLLVVIHEGGHFLMARRNGVKVKEFGIGFPPRAVAWIKGDDGKWHRFYKKDWQTEQKNLIFSINWLPIGGFCSMDGESDADTRKGTFGAATLWQKTKILFGGVIMNWLTAIVIFTILAWTGLPLMMEGQFKMEDDLRVELHPISIASVSENSPASQVGIRVGDLISEASYTDENGNVDSIDVTDSITFMDYNDSHAGQVVKYTTWTESKNCSEDNTACEETDEKPDFVPEDFSKVTREVQLNPIGDEYEYRLGVTMQQTGQTLYHSTWSAPIVGVVTTAQITGETFRGLGSMVYNLFNGLISQLNPDEAVRSEGQAELKSAGDSVTGPVGILGTLFPAFVSSGLTNIAMLAAIISISLACMNILPIPALDGGRWILIAFYRLRNKKLDTETETKIVSRAFLVLLAIAVIITILDVVRIIR